MDLVKPAFGVNLEWAMYLTKLPAGAYSLPQCTFQWVSLDRASIYEPGSLFVECKRNGKGVYASILLPGGYPLPTWRVAPKDSWFQMLKVHLRSWLSLSKEGRVVRAINECIENLQRDQKADAGERAQSIAALESIRATVLGELQPSSSERDVIASFYDWLAVTSSSLKSPQKDVLAIIEKAIVRKQLVPVQDLDMSLFSESFDRFLDV